MEFDSEIEWREDKKFLKVEFPVDVHNTEVNYSPPLAMDVLLIYGRLHMRPSMES